MARSSAPEIVAGLKRGARRMLPVPARRLINRLRMRRSTKPFEGLPNQEIFSTVYSNSRYWGNEEGTPFTSGEGTSAEEVTTPYVDAVRAFLGSFPEPPRVVDLGCGDFTVGARLRPRCGAYTACDVVPEVVESNRRNYSDADVDFFTIDMARDSLPQGEVVFIRQVLQHLSNADIAAVVPKLSAFRHVIITEHVPAGPHQANIDMPTGPWTRLSLVSGVDIALPPFNFPHLASSVLCEIPQSNAMIRTTHYVTR